MAGAVERAFDDLAADIAATGLRAWPPWRPPDTNAWHELLQVVTEHRLVGLAHRAAASGQLDLDPSQLDDLEQLHRDACRRCLLLEDRLVHVHELLAAHGVGTRVLKGSAVAHLDYEDPADRTFGDIDVLVRPESLEVVVELAAALGYVPTYAEPNPGYRQRFGKGVSLAAPGGFELDVHRTLAPGPYGFGIDLDELFDPPAVFDLAGRPLPALPLAPRFIHACLHAVLAARPKLWPLRDVASIHRHPQLSVDDVTSTAERWQVGAVVAAAVVRAESKLGLGDGPLLPWAEERRTRRADRRRMASYGPGRTEAARAAASISMIPGWRERARFVRSLVVPARSFSAVRGGPGRRLRRAARDVWRWRTRG